MDRFAYALFYRGAEQFLSFYSEIGVMRDACGRRVGVLHFGMLE